MPNNDLCTAHGRILIDFEDRGSTQAAAAVIKIQKQFEQMQKRVDSLERILKKNNTTLEKSSRSLKKTESSGKSYAATLFGIDRITKIFDKDVVDLTQDMLKLARAYETVQEKAKPFRQVFDFLDRYQRLKPDIPISRLAKALGLLRWNSFGEGEKKVKSFYQALGGIDAVKKVLLKGFNEIALKQSSALSRMPVWTQQVAKLAAAMTKLGAIGLTVGAALDAGFINKFLNTNVFRHIVTQSTRAGGALEKFGKITEKVFGKNLFGGLAESLKNSEQGLDRFTRETSHKLSGASRLFNAAFKPIAKFSDQAKSFVFGAALVSAGITDIIASFSWLKKIPKPILMALGTLISTILPAAFQILSRSLTWISNSFAGLWVGVKTLTGGLAVLPGLLAHIGVVGATLATVFSGLGDAFKDVFSNDPVKAAEALMKLPPHLRPLAEGLKAVVKQFKEMRTELQKVAFDGLGDQIKKLGESYFPILRGGMTSVVLAMRGVKDAFVDFLQAQQTQKDTNTLFAQTAEFIGNIKHAFRPVMDGLRDMAVVGSRFITDLSNSFGGLGERFAEWARTNRESGRMMEWMQNARRGVVDLWKGLVDLTKGVWAFLTLFRTNTGANFFASWTEQMAKFRSAMERSAKGGFLLELANGVRALGGSGGKIKVFKDVFKNLVDTIQQVAPAIQNLSDAFSTIFVPALMSAISWIGDLSNIISMLGIDSLTGYILGVVSLFKLFPAFMKPTINAFRTLWGSFLIFKSAGGVMGGAKKAVETFAKKLDEVGWQAAEAGMEGLGGRAQKLAGKLKNVSGTLASIATNLVRFGGPIAAVVAALAGAFLLISNRNDGLKEFNDQLDTNRKALDDWSKSLYDAFLADRGIAGSNVIDQISLGLDDLISNLQDTAEKAPGFWKNIGEFLNIKPGGFVGSFSMNGIGGQSQEFNDWQRQGDNAKNAAAGLKQLRQEGADLESVLSGSKQYFDTYIASLRTQGIEAQAAANVLVDQRNKYDMVRRSMEMVGPAGVNLAAALDKMAKSGGDATSSLEALTSILQELGFLQVDQMQAALDYTTVLDEFSSRIDQVVAAHGNLADAWDASTNSLNDQSVKAAALLPIFADLASKFRIAANSGQPMGELMSRLNAQLDANADKLGTNKEKLKEFFALKMGIQPEIISLAVQLKGKDEVVSALGYLLMELSRQAQTGIPVQLLFQSKEAIGSFQEKLKEIMGGQDITEVNDLVVSIKPGFKFDEAQIIAIQKAIAAYGIQMPNGPIVDPSTIPVAPPTPMAPPDPVNPNQPNAIPPWAQSRVPGASPQPFTPPNEPFYPAPVAPAGAPPFPAPIDTGGLTDANAEADNVQNKLDKFASTPAVIRVNKDELEQAGNYVDDLEKKFSEKKLKTEIQVDGLDKLREVPAQAQGMSDQIGKIFSTLKESMGSAVEEVKNKVKELSDSIINTLNAAAESAKSSGSKFVDALAAGISSNPAAVQAAEALAGEIKKRFHQSPPKKGPLAAHGDAARYGGEMFVDSYAQGLRTAAPLAGEAAGSVAGAALGGAQGGAKGAGSEFPFGQEILKFTGFANSLVDTFSKVTDTFFKMAKFMSDPLGKGTFFGQSLGFKRLSAEELKLKRDREDQQGLRSFMDSGQRDDTVFQNKMQRIKDSENAVVDQKGYKSGKAAKTVGALIKEAFPEIASIGGARADSKPYHREGNAIDIMIPDFETKAGKALGDKINNWALSNAKQLGIDYTIWQDFYQPTDGSAGNFMGNKGVNEGHYNHIHLNFAPGASVDLSGIEMSAAEMAAYNKQSAQDKAKTALQALQETYGPPALSAKSAIKTPQAIRLNPVTGGFETYIPEGQKNLPDGYINPETKKPWTPAEVKQYKLENPLAGNVPDGMTIERLNQMMTDPNFVSTSQEETLALMADSNDQIAKALEVAQDPRAYDDRQNEVINALTAVDNEINRLNETGTVGDQQRAQDLETIKSTIMDKGGYGQNENPIDQVAGFVSSAAGVASDLIGTFVSGVEALGAAEDMTKMLGRGISNTEQVGRLIDDAQKFLEFGGKIAGSVASVTSMIGSIAGPAASAAPGGGGVGAAISAVSTIASLVQAGFETANAVIDITQEAVTILGGYVGEFLGYLVGGTGGQLTGNVKFLLDQQTNQLLAYTADNPMDKRAHNVPFAPRDMQSREQMIGNINVYGGPGSDPRDLTRQMMYQVSSAQYAGALSQ